MLKHVVFFIVALLASCEVAANEKEGKPVKSKLVKKGVEKKAAVEEYDDDEYDEEYKDHEYDFTIPREDEDEDDLDKDKMEDIKMQRKLKDEWVTNASKKVTIKTTLSLNKA